MSQKTPLKPTFFGRFRREATVHQQKQVNKHSVPIPRISSADHGREARASQIQTILEQPIIDLERIRAKAWAGVPDRYRAKIWRLFLDYEPVNASLRDQTLAHKRGDYFDCLERVYSGSQRSLWTNAQKQTIAQIRKDLPRTHLALLRNPRVQDLFERVLFVYSVRHPASGYVQGMNDVLQPFFFAFVLQFMDDYCVNEIEMKENVDNISEEDMKSVEADCFWCFSKLLDGLQDLYTKDQPGLYKMLEGLQNVVDRVLPDLSKHIQEEDIQYQEFAFRWVNCLLVREFSLSSIFRIWDSYLSNHNRISNTHIYVCAAVLNSLHDKIMPLSHPEFVMYLQSIDPNMWTKDELEELLAQAYVYEGMFSQSPSHMRSASMPNLLR